MKSYDLVVIGTGTAASAAANRCREAGWLVAMIDHLPFGGTCALRGCDPKKVLVGAAEAVDLGRRLRGKGVDGSLAIEWPALIAFKRRFTEPVPPAREKSFAARGIDAFHGRARFTGARRIAVGDEALEGRFVLIAAGAVPMRLGLPGEELLATSTEFLELERLPKRIAFVGGGYIAAEFSHVAARAGAAVIILEQARDALPQFDPELVERLLNKSRALGIDPRFGARVAAIERAGDGFAIRLSEGGMVQADLVVHGAGRVPDLDALDLDAAGIARDGRRLKLNDYLQSVSNPAVYAAGDAAASGPPLTPVASHEGRAVAENMLEGNRRKPDYRGVPSVVFTTPPLARVGLLEAEAQKAGLRFRCNRAETSGWYTARRLGEDTAGYKVLIEDGTDRILGAHLLGPHAEEVINLFALAIRARLPAQALRDMIWAYPTAASDLAYML